MKKFYPRTFLLVILSCFFFHACVKDTCKRTYNYTYYLPVYKTMAEVLGNIKSNSPKQVEKPGKIYIMGHYIFLNEIDKGIHVIDNSNPSNPKNISFIDIPGNLDIAVKGTTLYADFYRDLVALDITNPENVIRKKVISNVFSHRYYPYGFVATNDGRVIVDWERRDTTVTESCSNPGIWMLRSDVVMYSSSSTMGANTAQAAASPIGMGGSMARFAIVHERLYAVTNSTLNIFNISSPTDPTTKGEVNVGWNIETIFPFNDKLFIGSQSGMFIYNISNPDLPFQISQFGHVRSCDPVIADDKYAYVTLRSGTPCQGFTNQLEVLKLENLATAVTLLKTYPMNNPHGLSKSGELLFICDGTEGLKVYNASDANNLQLIKKISDIETFDVIAFNDVALVVAKDGLYQYDYSDANNIRLLSKITIAK